MVSFPNGSFETGDLSEWTVTYPVSQFNCFAFPGVSNKPYNVDVSDTWASAGSFSARFTGTGDDPPTAQNSCGQLIPDNNVFDGNFTFMVDYNISQSGTKFISFIINGAFPTPASGCGVTIGAGTAQAAGTLQCTPNIIGPYTVDFLYRCAGGAGTCAFSNDDYFDNFRYEKTDEVCKNVVYKGDPSEKIDVVFVGSGFPSLSKLEEVVNEMIEHTDLGPFTSGLLSFKPFSDYKDRFNFWMVNSLPTFNGGMKQNLLGLWYHDNQYMGEADEVVNEACLGILESTPQYIALMVEPRVRAHAVATPATGEGGGKAYITIGQEYLDDAGWPLEVQDYVITTQDVNLAESKNEVQKTTVHEFGHSFGGLADEYSAGYHSGLLAFDVPNCTHSSSCADWNSLYSGITCNQGCTYQDWYRPFDQSMMRDTTFSGVTFGAVSEYELESDINMFTNVLFSQISTPNSYFLKVNYKDGNMSLRDISLKDKTVSTYSDFTGTHNVKLYSAANEIIYDVNIFVPIISLSNAPIDWFDSNGNQISFPGADQILYFSDLNFVIAAPHFSNAKTLKVFDKNATERLFVDLGKFSTQIDYSIGISSGSLESSNYRMRYSLTNMLASNTLVSGTYVCEVGPIPFGA